MLSHDAIALIQLLVPVTTFVLFFSGMALQGGLALIHMRQKRDLGEMVATNPTTFLPTPASVLVLWSVAFGLMIGDLVGSVFEKAPLMQAHDTSAFVVGGLLFGLLITPVLFKQYQRFEVHFHHLMTCLRQRDECLVGESNAEING